MLISYLMMPGACLIWRGVPLRPQPGRCARWHDCVCMSQYFLKAVALRASPHSSCTCLRRLPVPVRSLLRLARENTAQGDATALCGHDHPRAYEAGPHHRHDVMWPRGYECAAVWFGGGSSEPPHGLYGPKTPIAIPTSHRSVTSLALTEIGWRGT